MAVLRIRLIGMTLTTALRGGVERTGPRVGGAGAEILLPLARPLISRSK